MPQCSTCGCSVSVQDTVCPDCGMDLSAGPQVADSNIAPASQTTPLDGSAVGVNAEPPSAAALSPLPQPAAGQAKLTLRRTGTLTNEAFALADRATIGRFDVETGPIDVDMGPLPEGAYLSRRHAEVWRDGNGNWFIKDLGSQNGTFVRPASSSEFQRVSKEHIINDGDEIAFGNARFEFRIS